MELAGRKRRMGLGRYKGSKSIGKTSSFNWTMSEFVSITQFRIKGEYEYGQIVVSSDPGVPSEGNWVERPVESTLSDGRPFQFSIQVAEFSGASIQVQITFNGGY